MSSNYRGGWRGNGQKGSWQNNSWRKFQKKDDTDEGQQYKPKSNYSFYGKSKVASGPYSSRHAWD